MNCSIKAKDYLQESKYTNITNSPQYKEQPIIAYGLIGEIGSLVSVIKRACRDHSDQLILQEEVREEIGDILWYLFEIMRQVGYNNPKWPTQANNGRKMYYKINDIISAAADIYSTEPVFTKSDNYDKKLLFNQIDSLLAGLHQVSLDFSLKLENLANDALDKNNNLWGKPASKSPIFDKEYPEYERLPRKFTITFMEANKSELIISMKGVQLGDRLTDNTYDDSGYRYHDIFHMAAATYLGWSPVFRRMLKAKRKSVSRIDQIEDGARAAIIEEAIISQVYRYGKSVNFKKPVNVEKSVVELIMQMAIDYECKDIKAKDWKLFIVESINLFGKVKNGFEGSISFDADKRSYKLNRA